MDNRVRHFHVFYHWDAGDRTGMCDAHITIESRLTAQAVEEIRDFILTTEKKRHGSGLHLILISNIVELEGGMNEW